MFQTYWEKYLSFFKKISKKIIAPSVDQMIIFRSNNSFQIREFSVAWRSELPSDQRLPSFKLSDGKIKGRSEKSSLSTLNWGLKIEAETPSRLYEKPILFT